AFREFLDQHSQVREVTSQSSDARSKLSHVARQLIDPDADLIDSDAELANLRVILALAFEQELNRSFELVSSHQRPFSTSFRSSLVTCHWSLSLRGHSRIS